MRCDRTWLRTGSRESFFCIDKKGRMVLLHGFIKKTQKTPNEDLDLARRNKNKHQRGLQ